MERRLRVMSALALVVVAGSAHAQTAPDTSAAFVAAPAAVVPLTLPDAVRLALLRSPDLERAGYTVAQRALDVREAEAAGDPALSVSVGPTLRLSRTYGTNFFGIPQPGDSLGAVTLGVGNRVVFGVSAGVNLDLPILDGGVRRANREAAARILDAARLDLSRTAEDVARLAAAQYVQALQSDALVSVEDTSLAADRALLRRVQAEYDVGNRDIGDVLQQQAAIAQGEVRLATVRRNAAVARLGLRQSLRLPPGTELALDPSAAGDIPLPSLDVPALVARAFRERTDLTAQAVRIEAARFDVRAARAGRAPNLSLGAQAGTSYSSFDDNRGAFGQVFDVNPNSSVGLTLAVPILDRGRTRRAVERAEVAVADNGAFLEQRQLQVASDVETAVLDVVAAQARLDASEAGVAAARQALAANEARYRVGAGVFLDVLDARRQLVRAASDAATARFDLLLARIAVAYQTGALGAALVGR